VNKLLDTVGRSPEGERLLTLRYFAPYLLVKLIDRDTFMKMNNFDTYNRCLENSSYLDLEELSKNLEYEERFNKFMRYIEILKVDDPRKIEG
jgi:hypothetical protein